MARIVHLSDLHMGFRVGKQAVLFDELVGAMARERAAAPDERFVVAITGDVFDSSVLPADRAVARFLDVHARVSVALGGDVPTLVLPGNHDRRRFGLVAPNSGALFRALHDAVDPARVYVAGCAPPFLAEVIPDALHGLPFHVIAYDSTYLPGGLIGAGGTIRLEDLLMANAKLPDDGRPLLVLTHHHLIPTPLTDVSHIDSAGASRLTRWAIKSVLPALVSYGDREELTMTALGAGTALTTLHTFGRAVLLLHGHKHVPTARLVAGMSAGCGDVLVASAGSAGTRERVHATRHPDAARLWPSYNLVHVDDDRVHVEAVAFSPKPTLRPPLRRELATARIAGPKWSREPVSFRVKDPAPRIDLDEATYVLTASRTREYWDYQCERRIELRPGARLRRYIDFVHALPGPLAAAAHATHAPHVGGVVAGRHEQRIVLNTVSPTRYERRDALCRTLVCGARARGAGTAFEWVGLLSRYGAARAVLRLAQEGAGGLTPFASVTDLTIGRERPVRLVEGDGYWTLTDESCPPRSLLRIYWPLIEGTT